MGLAELERRAPEAYRALLEARHALEDEFHDMQDFEFTVEEGRLYVLQARTGKRTPLAALRIPHDLVEEGTTASAAIPTSSERRYGYAGARAEQSLV
jgi:pyruvate,orthophosphate dikinase